MKFYIIYLFVFIQHQSLSLLFFFPPFPTTGTVKEILGTAQSVGCTIDGKHPHDLIEEINSGEREIEDYNV